MCTHCIVFVTNTMRPFVELNSIWGKREKKAEVLSFYVISFKIQLQNAESVNPEQNGLIWINFANEITVSNWEFQTNFVHRTFSLSCRSDWQRAWNKNMALTWILSFRFLCICLDCVDSNHGSNCWTWHNSICQGYTISVDQIQYPNPSRFQEVTRFSRNNGTKDRTTNYIGKRFRVSLSKA